MIIYANKADIACKTKIKSYLWASIELSSSELKICLLFAVGGSKSRETHSSALSRLDR